MGSTALALAVDLWRIRRQVHPGRIICAGSSASTFTTAIPQPPRRVDALSQPLQVGAAKTCRMVCRYAAELNKLMDRMIKWLEGTNTRQSSRSMPASSAPQPPGGEIQKKTAMQVINEMVKARLTQPEVDILDDQGVRGGDNSQP
jgi:hypothetical protein